MDEMEGAVRREKKIVRSVSVKLHLSFKVPLFCFLPPINSREMKRLPPV